MRQGASSLRLRATVAFARLLAAHARMDEARDMMRGAIDALPSCVIDSDCEDTVSARALADALAIVRTRAGAR